MSNAVDTLERIRAFHPELTAVRHDLHAHPELGLDVPRTADVVAKLLASWGIDVHRGIGGHGVVGVLRQGNGGRSIGLRADMDALPILEATGVGYGSKNAGTMHACGHDGHTVMLLGAARYLAETRDFSGTVNFVFQPGEEGAGGALAMLEDRLFERFPCDEIFGLHNRPGAPIGQFSITPGAAMAGGAFFDITVTGRGAHGARPETGIDSVLVASHIAIALQSIVSRNVRPVDAAVLSVTKIHGGDAYNVIPQTAQLSGTARAFTREVLELIETNMRRVARGTAEAFGATAEVDFRVIFAPTVNDAQEAEFAAGVCTELVGAENVNRNPNLIVASEDFSFMLEKVPGCYFNIGNGAGEGACEVHNPSYDFNDGALTLGASAFARIVETRLSSGMEKGATG